MKFATFVLSAAALYAASTVSIPIKRDVDPNLVPQFGLQSGVNPDGTGNCDGITGSNGKPILIPCACPPPRDEFLQDLNANVAAGFVINNPSVKLSFPTDNSKASQNARLNAAAVTLQNLHGPGKGCPVASTTFSAQQQVINAEDAAGNPPPSAPPASSPAAPSKAASSAAAAPSKAASSAPPPAATSAAAEPPVVCAAPPPAATTTAAAAPPPPKASSPPANNAATSNNGQATPDQVAQLAPDLGFTAGKNPTGTGDCDGAVNDASGKPIKVPCACPPDRATFIAALQADVAAGHAVNNPSVKVTFPTDNSKSSQAARVEAAIIALQNLNGPGKGCPVVSTTLGAQQKALQ